MHEFGFGMHEIGLKMHAFKLRMHDFLKECTSRYVHAQIAKLPPSTEREMPSFF
ncbi:hypothetical protein [Neobacillus terrae]|uniref:hypothetical protein n=1 Tax=Neobacillus terrae TaxID=3034837 RepID=UPI0014089DFC|nr:hypothetical protein [Neobacillus terrae]NHM30165.1 hypothetical protein [Neobacillus terrae]